jgi:phosphopentomutase
MDSVGCGGAPDAAAFGDEGANTLGHIADFCTNSCADMGRSGPLNIPNLLSFGLGAAVAQASGHTRLLEATSDPIKGIWGSATEHSIGKDTPSGHWELMGLPVPFDWHYFPQTPVSFPSEILEAVARISGTEGSLANCHASGTGVLDDFGAEHLKTGRPICYTSVDSVFQIAAHEEIFGLQRLQDLCAELAPMLHEMGVGRVIARPFVGVAGAFTRTPRRRDFALLPPEDLLIDFAAAEGRAVHAVGKIGDIFGMRGITDCTKGPDAKLMEDLVKLAGTAQDGAFVFANLVEFDSEYGHRRNVAGYARHLEWFDAQLPRLLENLAPDDLLLITADHGNDPTWRGTNHTRERVPVVGPALARSDVLGAINFADVGATIAAHLGLKHHGKGAPAI